MASALAVLDLLQRLSLYGNAANTIRGWSPAMRALPEAVQRAMRAAISERLGTALTETQLMASRDGVHFKRWNEAFIRPGVERPGTWQYGHQFAAWQFVETASSLPAPPAGTLVLHRGTVLGLRRCRAAALHTTAGWLCFGTGKSTGRRFADSAAGFSRPSIGAEFFDLGSGCDPCGSPG